MRRNAAERREGEKAGGAALGHLPAHHHGGFLRHLDRGGAAQDQGGREAHRPQGGAHLEGDAGLLADQRARLRTSPRHHDDRRRRESAALELLRDGAKVPHSNYCVPRVEVELAFILGKPLKGPGIGLADVLRATEYVVPAMEIVDARIVNPRKIFDTVADNGAAAGIVVGGRPIGPMEMDLRWAGGIMYRNSEIEETGLAAGVLGHPALGVAWLANRLGKSGVTLEAGHLILAGSFTRVVFANKGDTLHGDFGPLGGIAVQFV